MPDIERIERELREGLERATGGEWFAHWDREAGEGWDYYVKPSSNPFMDNSVAVELSEANAQYIVAAQPENIRALLDELARRAEIIERAKEVIRPFARASTDASGWAVIVHDQTAKDARNTARAFLESLEPTHAE